MLKKFIRSGSFVAYKYLFYDVSKKEFLLLVKYGRLIGIVFSLCVLRIQVRRRILRVLVDDFCLLDSPYMVGFFLIKRSDYKINRNMLSKYLTE